MLMPNVAAPKANALADRIKIYLTNAGVSVKTFNYDFEKLEPLQTWMRAIF